MIAIHHNPTINSENIGTFYWDGASDFTKWEKFTQWVVIDRSTKKPILVCAIGSDDAAAYGLTPDSEAWEHYLTRIARGEIRQDDAPWVWGVDAERALIDFDSSLCVSRVGAFRMTEMPIWELS